MLLESGRGGNGKSVLREPPHPGFDVAPIDVSHLRVETFADGTVSEAIVDGHDLRQADGGGLRVVEATDAYLGGHDMGGHGMVVGRFLAERCEMGPREVETASALYAAGRADAKAAGEVPGTQRQLAVKLERRGCARERTRHVRLYRGVRLLRAQDEDRLRDAS